MVSTFVIRLPRVEKPVDPPRKAPPALTNLRGKETVLVAEDQTELRRLAALVLEGYGYKVLEADSGEDALVRSGRYNDEIHLLLTDVVMPGMSGRELVGRLRPSRPEMKVLYMSGHDEKVIVRHGVLDAGLNYLEKPFLPTALAEKVREVLGPANFMGSILVVDDEASVRDLLATVLTRAGYEVLEAPDGIRAVEQMQRRPCDLVLMDLVMPGQEGIETIRAMLQQWPDLKIIAMSGAFGGEFLDVAEKLGARASLLKPMSSRSLLESIRRVMNE